MANAAVLPAHQVRWYRRRSIAFADDQAPAAGRPSIWLYAASLIMDNQTLHRSLGFVEFARDTIEGQHRVRMRKPFD